MYESTSSRFIVFFKVEDYKKEEQARKKREGGKDLRRLVHTVPTQLIDKEIHLTVTWAAITLNIIVYGECVYPNITHFGINVTREKISLQWQLLQYIDIFK